MFKPLRKAQKNLTSWIVFSLLLLGLQCSHQTLELESDPAGAKISQLNGKIVSGTTPMKMALPDGTYQLSIEKEGLAPAQVEFQVKGGKNSVSQPIQIKLKSYLDSRKTTEHWINQVYKISDEQGGTDVIVFRKNSSIDRKNEFSDRWLPDGTWRVSDQGLTIHRKWSNKALNFPLHGDKSEAFTTYRNIGFGVKFKVRLFK